MDAQAFSLIEEMFERIDSNMPLKPTEQSEYARQLFGETGRSGGGIETIGEPDLFRTPIVDLGRWANDPWDQTIYGIDASTTRDFDYTNGLIMDTAYAKLGVGGSEADRAPEQAGTVKTVAYHDDSRSHIQKQTFSPRSVNGGSESNTGTTDLRAIRGEIVPYEADADSTQNLTKSISSVAQSLAEGEHAKRMLPEIDGPLFLDGSLYPLGVLYWVLLDHAGVTSPANRWDRPYEIVRNYLDVIDTLYERNLPVIGIVKTSTTSELTEALEAKIRRHEVADDDGIRPDVPWVRDHQFIADVLDNNNLNEFTYTSWFVSTELSAGRIDGEILEPFTDDLQHGEPGNYRRAFFYVRLPKQGFVLRVEAPLLFVRKDDERERIQTKALKEIAQRRDVPYSIKRADRIARITTENRETLLNTITASQSTRNYNDDGRWSDDDTSGLEPEDQ